MSTSIASIVLDVICVRKRWPWTRRWSSVHRGLLFRVRMKARRTWPFSQLVPRRLRWSYCTQCLYCLVYADDPPFEPRMATLSSATRVLNSASQPPSVDNGRCTKGSLSSLPWTSFRFENLNAVYLAVEQFLVLTFDLSSIFCGALASPVNTADLLFLGPSQIWCSFVNGIERIQFFLSQE